MFLSLKMILNALLKKGFTDKKNCYVEFPCMFYNNKFEGKVGISRNSRIDNSEIGFGTYIGHNCDFRNVRIGRYCSIAPNVKNIHGQHPTSIFVSTHPAFYTDRDMFHYVAENKFVEYRHVGTTGKSIVVGNDVWIGEDVRIQEGVYIGDGAVIAAGAMVTKDVPPYAVVGGIPAKIIKYRFTEYEIEQLLKIQWWNKDEEWIRKYSNKFENVEFFISEIGR